MVFLLNLTFASTNLWTLLESVAISMASQVAVGLFAAGTFLPGWSLGIASGWSGKMVVWWFVRGVEDPVNVGFVGGLFVGFPWLVCLFVWVDIS